MHPSNNGTVYTLYFHCKALLLHSENFCCNNPQQVQLMGCVLICQFSLISLYIKLDPERQRKQNKKQRVLSIRRINFDHRYFNGIIFSLFLYADFATQRPKDCDLHLEVDKILESSAFRWVILNMPLRFYHSIQIGGNMLDSHWFGWCRGSLAMTGVLPQWCLVNGPNPSMNPASIQVMMMITEFISMLFNYLSRVYRCLFLQ